MTAAPLLAFALIAADAPPAKDKPADYEAELNDKLAAGVTPQTNAVVLLWQAIGPTPEGGRRMPAEYFRRLGIPEPPKGGDYFVGLSDYARDRLGHTPDEVALLQEAQTPTSRRPWAAKDHPRIARWLAANEKSLAVVVEATRRPAYYDPLVSTRNDAGESSGLYGVLQPIVQKCRELAAALVARAMLRLGEGNADAAWADLLACHRLGRLAARGGTLLDALVGVAVDSMAARADLACLAAARLTAEQARARLKELRSLPAIPPIADKIDLGERAAYLDALTMVRRGGLGVLDEFVGGKAKPQDEAARMALARLDWGPAVKDGNRWYDRMAVALRQPDRAARRAAMDGIEADLKKLRANAVDGAALARRPGGEGTARAINNVLLGLTMPAIGKVQDAHDRAVQQEQNLSVAFALAAFRADHGKYPAKLADLSPKYLDPIPGDLFSGKSLVYRPAADGYVFYSVGLNGTDDGGRLLTDPLPGDDLGVRMPPEVPEDE